MSISSEITRIQNKRDLSFIEVENKGVTVPAGSTIDDLPGLIAQIERGGGGGYVTQDANGNIILPHEGDGEGGGDTTSADRNDVNFYDYDGTVVASYTASDFANLSTLPANPSHSGLTAQGWNWTLNDAKTYVGKYGKLEAGQMYVTDDGKTRLYCRFEQGRLAPYLGIGVNGTVIVDWGDNTVTDTLTGTSLTTAVHTNHVYSEPGAYVITLNAVSGSFSFFGLNFLPHILKKDSTSSGTVSAFLPIRIYAEYCLERVEFGSGALIGNYAFQYCKKLKSVTIPNSITSIGTSAFSGCTNLKYITIPNSVTTIGESAFSTCTTLKCASLPNTISIISNYLFNTASTFCYVTIPDTVTSIGTQAFASAGLFSIIFPDSVASISSQVLYTNYSLGEVHFKSATPPVLANSNVFQNIQTDCIIYVPSGSLSAYTSATNYPSSSSYTYMEE